jgi:hypothetical protein
MFLIPERTVRLPLAAVRVAMPLENAFLAHAQAPDTLGLVERDLSEALDKTGNAIGRLYFRIHANII